MGFEDFRVRMREGQAVLQLKEEQLPLIVRHRQAVLTELKKYYKSVVLDMEVR